MYQLKLFDFEYVVEKGPGGLWWLDINLISWTGEKFLLSTDLLFLWELVRGDAFMRFVTYGA